MVGNTVTRAIEIGLRFASIWPDASYVIASRIVWTATMLVAIVFQYRYVLSHFNFENLSSLMEVLSMSLSYTLVFIKLNVFWTKQRILSDLLPIIATDWKEQSDTDHVLYIMSRTANLSKRFSNFIISLHTITVFSYGVGVVVQRANNNREMILKMDLPFESNKSPVYELITTTQLLHLMSTATINGVLSALLVTLVLHAGGQIDILREKILDLLPSDKKPAISIITIGSLIRRHQRIIVFTEKIENLYSYIALAQFLSNTVVICCLGFTLINSIGGDQSASTIMKSLLFYVCLNLEAFIFCFAGEYLSIKSTMIGDAAYESLWYDLTPSESRILLFLMMRSQKQLTITVGKFTNLSLRQFGNIVKSSASYISVLLAL